MILLFVFLGIWTPLPRASTMTDFNAGLGSMARSCRIGQPIGVKLYWNFMCAPQDLSITIQLSNQLRLVSGNLQWSGIVDRGQMYLDTLFVQPIKPGIHEVTATFSATRFLITGYENRFPYTCQMFIYADSDTIAYYWDRARLERDTHDSTLIPPRIWNARRMKQTFEEASENRHATNSPPLIVTESLDSYLHLYFAIYDRTGFSEDQIFDQRDALDISQHRTFNDVTVMCGNRSFPYFIQYNNPLVHLREFISQDLHQSVSSSLLDSLVVLVNTQYQELYALDQQIVQSTPQDDRRQLAKSRDQCLQRQTTERAALLNFSR